MIKQACALIGIGEIGGIIAKGLLRLGHPVYPLTRDMPIAATLESMPKLRAVVVAVGEKDLHDVLAQIPRAFHDRLVLIQNELLPRDWQAHGIESPTVASIWFEKKPGKAEKVLIPTPVQGSLAELVVPALESVGIAAREVDSPARMLEELVIKNVYILTTNIAGLEVGGHVADLWAKHRELAESVADEVIALQQWLTGETLDRQTLIDGMLRGFEGDPAHQCMGRSAPARLERALALAEEAGVKTPVMQRIRQQTA